MRTQSTKRNKMIWRGLAFSFVLTLSIIAPGRAEAQQWTTGTNANDINNTNSGNVGVGTSNPASRFEIAKSGSVTTTNTYDANNPLITIRNSQATNNNYAGIGFANSAASGWLTSAIFGVNESHTTTPSGHLEFFVKNAGSFLEAIRITSDGKVGIGVTNPNNKLHVAGSISVDGNINAKYQDVAEWVLSTDQLAAGTVVVLDPSVSNQVVASTQAYDTRVAGVISSQPGITLGEKSENKVLVATVGRVRIKVDATRAPINIGDLLVTSDSPGVAMKSEPVNLSGVQLHRPGTLIGKALEPLTKGHGEILVLLSLQ